MRLSYALFAMLIACSSFAEASDQTCATDERVVDACYSVHGTLRIWANGRPRLNPTGTKRLLGIAEKSKSVSAGLYWPSAVDKLLSKDLDATLTGDFLVCPFTYEKPHEMKIVCIDSVSNLSLQHRGIK